MKENRIIFGGRTLWHYSVYLFDGRMKCHLIGSVHWGLRKMGENVWTWKWSPWPSSEPTPEEAVLKAFADYRIKYGIADPRGASGDA